MKKANLPLVALDDAVAAIALAEEAGSEDDETAAVAVDDDGVAAGWVTVFGRVLMKAAGGSRALADTQQVKRDGTHRAWVPTGQDHDGEPWGDRWRDQQAGSRALHPSCWRTKASSEGSASSPSARPRGFSLRFVSPRPLTLQCQKADVNLAPGKQRVLLAVPHARRAQLLCLGAARPAFEGGGGSLPRVFCEGQLEETVSIALRF